MIPRTPFPSALIDGLMPSLRDTEWRVVCFIVRQTWGWKAEGGGRKRQDWITHSRFVKATGRSSEAVSRAIDSLVKRGVIIVTGTDGQALSTPQARRRHRGCLLYGVVSVGAPSYPQAKGYPQRSRNV